MQFLVYWSTKPEHRDEACNRFKNKEHALVDGIKLIGSWQSVNQTDGWVIVETSDAVAIGKWLSAWSDLNVIKVTPIVDDEGMRKILGG